MQSAIKKDVESYTGSGTAIVQGFKKFVGSHLGLVIAIAVVYVVSLFSTQIFHAIEVNQEGHLILPLFIACVLFVLGGMAHYVTLPNKIPSFVAAIFLGIAARPILTMITGEAHVMMAIVSAAVVYVLFSGGLETKWEDFKALFWKIFSLSFLGLFATAFLFSLSIFWLGGVLSYEISLVTAALLGAVLASTDPAALIPVLNNLSFRKGKGGLKDIAIAESALTDVTGALLTSVFVLLIEHHVQFVNVAGTYGQVFTWDTVVFLVRQIVVGGVVGYAGYLVLDLLHAHKGGLPAKASAALRKVLPRSERIRQANEEHDADTAFFFAVPLFAFVVALGFGGSGYLAAFLVGLFLGTIQHLHKTETFLGRSIEAFLKPTIFVILGAMVNPGELIAYAPIGIIAALVFMFVIRPLAVFLSLSIWLHNGKRRMDVRDLLFLSFVRETGAIPAALLITLVGKGIGGAALVPIGMWVILATLIIQPMCTPYVARRLGIAD